MKTLIFSLIITFIFGACVTPRRVVVDEPFDYEVDYTIKKILTASAETTFSNIAKSNRNKLLTILPKNEIDSILYNSQLSEIDKQYKIDRINTFIAESVERLHPDFLQRIDFMLIENGEMIILNQEQTITRYFAEEHYAYLENLLTEHLIREGKERVKLKQFWTKTTNEFNERKGRQAVETKLPVYLINPIMNYLFERISVNERVIRDNISMLGDETVDKVYDYYIERYVYDNYEFY